MCLKIWNTYFYWWAPAEISRLEPSRAGHFNFRAESELTVCTSTYINKKQIFSTYMLRTAIKFLILLLVLRLKPILMNLMAIYLILELVCHHNSTIVTLQSLTGSVQGLNRETPVFITGMGLQCNIRLLGWFLSLHR